MEVIQLTDSKEGKELVDICRHLDGIISKYSPFPPKFLKMFTRETFIKCEGNISIE